MFNYGDVVTFIEGIHKETTGVIWKVPSEENLNHYTVITEDRPYGYWALEEELTMKFEESADKKNLDKEIRDRVYTIKLLNEEYDLYIPKDQDPDIYMMEMAEINPKFTKNAGLGFKVLIEPKEGPIPHVHVRFKNGQTSHIKLGKAEYLNGHEKKDHILTRNEANNLIEFFNSKILPRNKKNSNMTSWEFAVLEWESLIDTDERQRAFDTAFQLDKNGNNIMPDYNKLPKLN